MECHDVSSRPDGVNGHTIFKKAKIGGFLYSQSGSATIKKINNKRNGEFPQATRAEEKVFGDDFLALHG